MIDAKAFSNLLAMDKIVAARQLCRKLTGSFEVSNSIRTFYRIENCVNIWLGVCILNVIACYKYTLQMYLLTSIVHSPDDRYLIVTNRDLQAHRFTHLSTAVISFRGNVNIFPNSNITNKMLQMNGQMASNAVFDAQNITMSFKRNNLYYYL